MASTPGSSYFARGLGAFLVIEGVWGLFSDVVFGILPTNRLRAVIHLALGIIGIAASYRGNARVYLRYGGALLVAVGITRVIPFVGELVVRMLNVSYAGALLNIVIGLTALAVAAAAHPVRKRLCARERARDTAFADPLKSPGVRA